MTPKITLLGGTLGAGKTTLLENLLLNDSFEDNDKIIVMDAAGSIDYKRLEQRAKEKGIETNNATSACTVCDGPEAVFQQLKNYTTANNIFIELSGQMPLPVLQERLRSLGFEDQQSIYLLNPETAQLTRAVDEIPFANLIGFTKTTQPLAGVEGTIISKEEQRTLQELLRLAKEQEQLTGYESSHLHPPKGMSNKFHTVIQNPYLETQEIEATIQGLDVDRVKGYIARDAQTVLEFDKVHNRFDMKPSYRPDLGNGTILVANQGDNFFSTEDMKQKLSPLIDRVDEVKAILRIYSPESAFKEYINQAVSNNQVDDAMGAAEQFAYEQYNEVLIHTLLPAYLQGKNALLEQETNTLHQKVLQGMSFTYYLHEFGTSEQKQQYQGVVDTYKQRVDALSAQDWKTLREEQPPENITYIKLMREI